MIQSSNKKILELTPKAKKKSIHAIDPMEKFKNKIDKNFNKFIDAQKKLKDQFKENNKKAAKELNNLRKEIGTSRKETQQLLKQVSAFAETSPSEIREELINGIRMLGERVSSVINEINQRIDDFFKTVLGQN